MTDKIKELLDMESDGRIEDARDMAKGASAFMWAHGAPDAIIIGVEQLINLSHGLAPLVELLLKAEEALYEVNARMVKKTGKAYHGSSSVSKALAAIEAFRRGS
jgi:hypothetical protein